MEGGIDEAISLLLARKMNWIWSETNEKAGRWHVETYLSTVKWC